MQIWGIFWKSIYSPHGNSKPVKVKTRVLLGSFLDKVILIEMFFDKKIDIDKIPQCRSTKEGEEFIRSDVD